MSIGQCVSLLTTSLFQAGSGLTESSRCRQEAFSEGWCISPIIPWWAALYETLEAGEWVTTTVIANEVPSGPIHRIQNGSQKRNEADWDISPNLGRKRGYYHRRAQRHPLSCVASSHTSTATGAGCGVCTIVLLPNQLYSTRVPQSMKTQTKKVLWI